jgi:hypothetical protein
MPSATGLRQARRIVYYILGALEALLASAALKLLGANPRVVLWLLCIRFRHFFGPLFRIFRSVFTEGIETRSFLSLQPYR